MGINEKLLKATRDLSSNSYKKAMKDAKDATNLSSEMLTKGAKISRIIGMIMSVIGALFNRQSWGLSTLISGLLIVGVSLIQSRYVKQLKNR